MEPPDAADRLMARCRLLVRIGSRLVPAGRRDDWELEWLGELWHRVDRLDGWVEHPPARRRLLLAASGAVLHAAWLRALEWSLKMQDIRYGLRLIVRQPVFAFVVVATLALGMGANTAMFTIVNTVILRPLPYDDPGRLVWMYGSFALNDSAAVSPPDFLDYRERNRTLASMGAMTIGTATVNLSGSGEAERLGATDVSANLFATLGAAPILGRRFRPEEERADGPRVAIIGHDLWRDRFASDPQVVGKTIVIDKQPTTIVGVMPRGFRLPFDSGLGLSGSAALWTPIRFGERSTSVRRFHFLRAIGRLRPGVTLAQAQADLDGIARQLEATYRENESWKLRLVPLHEQVVGPIRPLLLILQTFVGLVLLVACANVMGLLLARAGAREGEVALRGALGASRTRLLRQLLTESLVLAVLGAAAGLGIAVAAVPLFAAAAPANLPRMEELALDPRVLMVTLVSAVTATLICGLAPALHLSRRSVADSIRGTARGMGSRTRGRLQRLLVVGQVATSLVLLAGAGLLARSVWAMQGVSLGLSTEHVLTAEYSLPERVYDGAEKMTAFYNGLLEHLRATPGVTAACAVTILPMTGGNDTSVHVAGRPPASDRERRYAQFRAVLGDFFRTFDIPLVLGRGFDERNPQAAARSVIINRRMAEEFFPGETAVGKQLVIDIGKPLTAEVIGIAGDVREWGPENPAPAIMYLSALGGPSPYMDVAVRAAGDPASLAPVLRAATRQLDPDLSPALVRSMDAVLGERLAEPRLRALLVAGFAGIALLLTLVGLYGALSYAVAQQTREIGVRLALGAGVSSVVRMVVGQGARLIVAGVLVGLAVGLAAARVMATLLFGVTPRDPMVFAAAATALVLAAFAAVLIPALRAARVDPVTALRAE